MNVLKFLETHKRLFEIVAAGIILLFITHKIVAHFDGVAHDARVVAEEQLKKTQQDNKAYDQQQAARDKVFQDFMTKAAREVASNHVAVAATRDRQAKQQEADKALPLPGIASRWGELLNLPAENFTVLPPDKVTVTTPVVQLTVQNLDELAADREVLPHKDSEISLLTGQIQACQNDINTLHEQVGRKNTEIAQQTTTCEAEKKDLKRQIAKEKRKGLLGWAAAALITLAKFGRF